MNTNQTADRRDGETVPLETVIATMELSPGGIIEGREVFAADEIRFEDALAVVKREMVKGLDSIREIGHSMQVISFRAARYFGGSETHVSFVSYNDNPELVEGATVNEVVARTGKPIDATARRIAQLRAELLALESENGIQRCKEGEAIV